jgi:prepilin-type N-terminal cleavage/methylation domain-containing protein
MNNGRGSSKGFSLVEVIVVMVILLILVSLLFPVFTRAKYGAKEVVCIQNVKQVFLAMELYAAEYEAYPALQPNDSRFAPYFGGTKLECPIAAGKPDAMRNPMGDYLVATPPPILDGDPDAIKEHLRAWAECRDLRGPEFPYVLDVNHLSAVERVERGAAFVILARAGGNAEKVLDRTKAFISGAPCPCKPELLHLNL